MTRADLSFLLLLSDVQADDTEIFEISPKCLISDMSHMPCSLLPIFGFPASSLKSSFAVHTVKPVCALCCRRIPCRTSKIPHHAADQIVPRPPSMLHPKVDRVCQTAPLVVSTHILKLGLLPILVRVQSPFPSFLPFVRVPQNEVMVCGQQGVQGRILEKASAFGMKMHKLYRHDNFPQDVRV